MGRAPCCEKMGLKKGPWTPEEDHILVDYIHRYGHGNWRALPKHAGLLRCGKSCRLRWTNYLRPDIKRGNFSREEEDTIIKLHAALGNRWSAIAARLPGRTDNEIKNVWNTHLRKIVNQIPPTIPITKQYNSADHQTTKFEQFTEQDLKPLIFTGPNSPQNSASEISSSLTTTAGEDNNFPAVDEIFWSDVFSGEYPCMETDFAAVKGDPQLQIPLSELYGNDSNVHDGMDLWYDLFKRGGEIQEFVEF